MPRTKIEQWLATAPAYFDITISSTHGGYPEESYVASASDVRLTEKLVAYAYGSTIKQALTNLGEKLLPDY